MRRIAAVVLVFLALALAGCASHGSVSHLKNDKAVQQVESNKAVQNDQAQLESDLQTCLSTDKFGHGYAERFEKCAIPAGLGKQDEAAAEACLQSKVPPALTQGKQAIIAAAEGCIAAVKIPSATSTKAGA